MESICETDTIKQCYVCIYIYNTVVGGMYVYIYTYILYIIYIRFVKLRYSNLTKRHLPGFRLRSLNLARHQKHPKTTNRMVNSPVTLR